MTDALSDLVNVEDPDPGHGESALRVVVVGPAAELARQLASAGHAVTLLGWVGGPTAAPGRDVAPRTVPVLRRARPDTWVRAGSRLRDVDAVVLTDVRAALVPAHLALLRAAGWPRSIAVLGAGAPRSGSDTVLVRRLLTRVDAVVVHDARHAARASALGARRVSVAPLPAAVTDDGSGTRGAVGAQRGGLLALVAPGEAGTVDLLLDAVASAPGTALTLAGPFPDTDRDDLLGRVARRGLADRVEVRRCDVAGDALETLLGQHEVLVVPPGATGGAQHVLLAHAHGLPVVAPALPDVRDHVRDGLDGLLVEPGDASALAVALRRLADPLLRRALAEGARTPDVSGAWAHYLGTIEALSSDAVHAAAEPADEEGPTHGAVARAAEVVRVARAARAARRRTVELRAADLPDWLRSTDVLVDPDDALDARRLARALGLPWTRDAVAAWSALGTLAAVVRVGDDGRRSTVVVEEGGSRSLLSRWARAAGFAPVQLGFTGSHPSVAALDVDAGSLDVVARVHPHGCTADDVAQVLEQASWALRPGGLLVVTVPLGPFAVDGALGAADVRAMLARGDDLGLTLVGDLDGELTQRIRAAASRARADDAAYGLVRLTLRRR